MNLIRLIVIGLIIWFLYRAVQRMLEKPRTTERPTRPASSRDMVKCAYCGIHIPRDEALEREGKYYCSTEHRDAAPR